MLPGCCLLKRPQIMGSEIAARNTLHAVKALGTASRHWGLHQGTGDCIKTRKVLLVGVKSSNMLHHPEQAEAVEPHQHIFSRGHDALSIVNDKAQPLGLWPALKKSADLFGHQLFTPGLLHLKQAVNQSRA